MKIWKISAEAKLKSLQDKSKIIDRQKISMLEVKKVKYFLILHILIQI